MGQGRLMGACVAAGLLFPSALHASDRIYRNQEYAFEIAVPQGHHVCIARTGGWHAHGLNYNIDRKPDCVAEPYSGPGKPAEISIWADYNAGFTTSVYPTWKGCEVSPLGASLRSAFKNKVRTWGTCVSLIKDGRTELNLLVLTGSYERSWGEEAGKPCLSYSMTLRTYPHRFNRDLIEFRKFLRKVRLSPGCGG